MKEKQKINSIKTYLCRTALLTGALLLSAQISYGADPEEESYYSNPAQAAHAAQLAENATANDDSVKEAYATYKSAEEAYEEAAASLPDEPTDEEQANVDSLFEAYEEALTSYEDTLSEKLGSTSEEIEGLRESGMGWGDIAHYLGVHPSVLGLGHTKKTQKTSIDQEIAEATSRDLKSGYAKGHGLEAKEKNQNNSSKNSVGLNNNGKSKSKNSVSNSPGKSASAPGQNKSKTSNKGATGKKDKSEKSNNGKGKGKNK